MDRIEELKRNFEAEPLGRLLGATLTDVGGGRAVVSAPARSEVLIARVGIVQGGIIAAVADYAGVYAAMSAIPAGHTPCAGISISFFRPVKGGETIEARAAVSGETRSQLFVSVLVTVPGGKDVALAMMTFAKPKP